MVNREYIKSQIDVLPDEVLIGVDKFLHRKIKLTEDKNKRNEEYSAKIKESLKQLTEGESVTFEWEEFEAMTEMPIEEAKAYAEKIKAKGTRK